MSKKLGGFKLKVTEGSFTNNEIVVLLGENGCGKTTFIKLLTGNPKLQPDEKDYDVIFYLNIDSRTFGKL